MSTAFSMALVVFDVSHSKIRKCRDMVLCSILLLKRSMVCLANFLNWFYGFMTCLFFRCYVFLGCSNLSTNHQSGGEKRRKKRRRKRKRSVSATIKFVH